MYEEGRLKAGLCIGPQKPLPRPDVILAHKLMLEGDEAGYLQTANHMPVRNTSDSAHSWPRQPQWRQPLVAGEASSEPS
jgi:hypothetical protein